MRALLSRLVVRPRAWWLNKVPLSITLVLLLLDGGALRLQGVEALVLVVLTICAVGNYGYALNDLYDVEEDIRADRANAALAIGRRRTAWIVLVSALAAELLSGWVAGAAGAALTGAELALPLAYSVPPLRVKERKGLGVAADALAAHVYPAALALIVVTHLGLRSPSVLVSACVLAWSLAVGIRGILSHQLQTADRDRLGGLETVVHQFGHLPIERFIIFGLLPIEAVGFIGAAVLRGGPLLWIFGGAFLACEAFRTLDGRFIVSAFRPQGHRYLPFVEESFYKAWGPIVIALDAARVDLKFLAVIPLYWLLFRPHLRGEVAKLLAIREAIRVPAKAS